MIYQVSCSELVTHLAITELEEIKEALRNIEKITGWKVGILNDELVPSKTPLYQKKQWIFVYNFHPIEIDKITIDEAEERVGILRNILPKEAYNCISEIYRDEILIPLVLFNKNTGAHLYVSLGDAYCSSFGLTFQAEQHCVTRDFPALADIIESYKSNWHVHDGGSSEDFIEWCTKEKREFVIQQEEMR